MIKDHLAGDLRNQIRENRENRKLTFNQQMGAVDSEEKPWELNPSQGEPNPMSERIRQWEESRKPEAQDLDFDFFCKIIDSVNGSSAIKVACNPVARDGCWIPKTPCRNVSKVEVDNEGRLVLYASRDKKEMPADKLFEQVQKLRKEVSGGSSPIMMKASSEGGEIQLTDAYSHSLVNEHWAGLPFDVVFAYYDEETRPDSIADLTTEDEEGAE